MRAAWLCLALAAFSPAAAQTCVQAQIAGTKPPPYNCINQQLEQMVQGTQQTQPDAPLSAHSPESQLGVFNRQGVAEQYGPNFGKSVIPYRPPAPVFSNSAP